MFDIGFFELLLISVVGLLVFGPEQFLDAIRTTAVWTKRMRRSFDEVRNEVQRELHNDQVMRELRDSTQKVQQEFRDATSPLTSGLDEANASVKDTLKGIAESVDEPAQATAPDAPADAPAAAPGSSAQAESGKHDK